MQTLEAIDHQAQLVLAPGLSRHVAIDILETERDPTRFVVAP